jgi:hypothetical protein
MGLKIEIVKGEKTLSMSGSTGASVFAECDVTNDEQALTAKVFVLELKVAPNKSGFLTLTLDEYGEVTQPPSLVFPPS